MTRHLATLATLAASPLQRRWAAAFVVFLVALNVVVWPVADRPGPVFPAFLPVYQTTVIIADLLTAVLLLSHFPRLGARSVLVLGCGYLFTAVMAAVHLASFPGILDARGLPGGGPQTTVYLWTFWHTSFPAFVLAYALMAADGGNHRRRPAARSLLPAAVLATLFAVAGLTFLVTVGHDLLPTVFEGGAYSGLNRLGFTFAMVSASVLALAALGWRTRFRSVLPLWLGVATLAFLLDVVASTLLADSRFSIGWYAGRLDSLVASLVVLGVYLLENSLLAQRLAVTLAAKEEAEEALRESEMRWRHLANALPSVVWTATADGRVTFVSDCFQAFTGLPPEAGSGLGWLAAIPPQERRTAMAALRRRFAAGKGFSKELRFRHVDGSVHWALIHGQPIRNGAGVLESWVGTAVDIDEAKRMQEMLLDARRDAERANREKSRFLAAASHDLRQPFQAMRLFHHMLQSQLAEGQSRKVCDRLGEAMASGETLIHGLLDISTIEAGRIEPKTSAFAIREVLRALANEFGPVAAEKGLVLRVVPSESWVRSDPVLLKRILGNLATNALRYTRKGGVLIGCRRRGPMLRIEVWDTGIGIGEDQLDAIFDDFYRIGDRTEGGREGLGLGLSIVRRLCALLGHRIEVRSRPGRGSVFTVMVPLTAAHMPAAHASQERV